MRSMDGNGKDEETVILERHLEACSMNLFFCKFEAVDNPLSIFSGYEGRAPTQTEPTHSAGF